MRNPPSQIDHAPLALVLLTVGVIGTAFEANNPVPKLLPFLGLIAIGLIAAVVAYRTRLRVRRLVCNWFAPPRQDRSIHR